MALCIAEARPAYIYMCVCICMYVCVYVYVCTSLCTCSLHCVQYYLRDGALCFHHYYQINLRVYILLSLDIIPYTTRIFNLNNHSHISTLFFLLTNCFRSLFFPSSFFNLLHIRILQSTTSIHILMFRNNYIHPKI